MEQVRIDFLVTGNMSSLNAQVQGLNASLMQSAGAVNLLDRSFQKLDVQSIQRQFSSALVASNQFDSQMVTLRSHTEGYGTALDRANVSGRKLWTETKSYMRGASGEIRALAREQIRLQNSVVSPLGRTATGAMNVGVSTPTGLGSDVSTGLRVANKEWEIFNRNAQLGATQMVNVGKNVQWAGRQLMVGFTVPLMMAGGMAAKTFYELDQSLIQLQKVYGSGLTFGEDFRKQSEMVREDAKAMALDLAQTYGQAGTETVDLMGQLAAAGYDNIGSDNLDEMTRQVTRLSTLGDMATTDAATASIALQTAFNLPVTELKETIDFMNAVENQTSLSLDDIVQAIPRAGTVIEGLGGDVQDLTLLLTAMKEGGVSAAEGANALKSGLSSMIAPPQAAVEFLKELGINLPKIVTENQGDIVGSITALQDAMKGLSDLQQQQAITKLFGKYQFARMGALFDNLGKKGSQTEQVMELMGMSMQDLGTIAEQELATKLGSASKEFDKMWESFKLSTAGVGEQVLKAGTWILEQLSKIMSWFNQHDVARQIAGIGLAILALVGPIVMVAGLFTNMAGTLLKTLLRVVNMFKAASSGGGINKQFQLLTVEGVAATQQLELMSGSLYDQATAEAVLREATELMEQQYITLGQTAMTTREQIEMLTEATQIQARAMASGTSPLMMTRANARQGAESTGLLLGTRGNNQGRTAPNYTAQEMGNWSNDKLARAGTMVGLVGSSGYTLPGATQASMAAAYEKAALGQATDWQNIVSRASNDPKVKAAYAAAHARIAALSVGATPEIGRQRYAAEVLAQEAQVMATKQTSSGTAIPVLKAMNATVANIGMTGNAFNALEFEALTSAEKLNVLATGKLNPLTAELEHLTSKSLTLNEALIEVTRLEDQYGLELNELKMQMTQRANKSAGLGLTEVELQAALEAFMTETRSVNVVLQAMEAEIRGFVSTLNVSDSGAQRMNKAFLQAAASAGAVSFAEIQVGETRYIAALDSAGNVIKEASYVMAGAQDKAAVALSGSTGAAKKGYAELTAAMKGAEGAAKAETRQSIQLTAAKNVEQASTTTSAAANKEETAASLAAASADRAEATASMVAGGAGVGGAPVGSAANKGFLGNLLSKFTGASKLTNVAGGASMLLPMMGTMMAPPDSVIGEVSKYAGFGSMLGMFGGPMGMVAGTAAGAAFGGIKEIFNAMEEESARAAALSAAQWESSFADISIEGTINEALNWGRGDQAATLELNYTERPTTVSDQEAFSAAVTENMGPVIDQMKELGTSSMDEILAVTERFYTEYVGQGYDPTNIRLSIEEAMRQAGVEEFIVPVRANLMDITTEKQAEDNIAKMFTDAANSAASKFDSIFAENSQPLDGSMYLADMDEETLGELMSAAKSHGFAYAEAVTLGIRTGLIKTIPQAMDAYENSLDKSLESITKKFDEDFGNMIVLPSYVDESKPGGTALSGAYNENTKYVSGPGWLGGRDGMETNGWFEGVSNNQEAIVKFLSETDDKQQEILNVLDQIGTAQASSVRAMLMASVENFDSVQEQIFKEFPEIKAYADEIARGNTILSDRQILLQAIARAEADWRAERNLSMGLESFINSGEKYVAGPQDPTNLNQLERQQGKEIEMLQESEDDKLEALQEAEDDRLEAMQKAADKRERLMQREIDQTAKDYDRQIAQIQNAEDKRQEAFQAEEDRFARRQEMRNLQISYDEAIANGDLFEAARIRMDMEAKRKQRSQETKAEKSQEKADKKVARLEKQKNQEVRLLEKALRVEQRMNERAIESAQKASEAKIEAAQEASDAAIEAAEKANKIELKDAAAKNKKIEQNQRDSNKELEKLFNLLLEGKRVAFNREAKELGIDAKERSAMITDWAAKQFGYLPDKILDSVTKALTNGNWDKLDGLMNLLVTGAKQSDIKKYANWSFNQSSRGDGKKIAMATGGFVSGPGSGTSDSIDANLSNGEYVVRQRSVARYGKNAMDSVNDGRATILPGFAEGGMVGPVVQGILGPVMESLMQKVVAAGAKMAGSALFGASSGKPGEYGGTAFDAQQLNNAEIIVEVGKKVGATNRDIITALATAMTESTLHNYKTAVDHDSLGLFQQRPSAGWGTPEQLTDPVYASKKFYSALMSISGRDEMSIGEAAQRVQVSAYPDRYADWVPEARAVMKSMKFSDRYVKPYSGNWPISRTFAEHGGTGEDIAMPIGTPLKAVTGGHLTNQPYAFGSYGNWYTIDNGDLQFLYAHLNQDKMASGNVRPGQIIGYSGNTGNSFGPHLHFEARQNGQYSNQTDPHSLNIPGLRKGGRINYDNTIANLHRGETVLTAPLTSAFEKNVAGGAGNTYNFNVDTIELHKELDLKNEFMKFTKAHERQQEQRTGRSRSI